MDEMNIDIKSSLLRNYISGKISKIATKNLGFDIEMIINQLRVGIEGDYITFKLNIEGATKIDELLKNKFL